jgi:predicted Ser/Thr protein kinase
LGQLRIAMGDHVQARKDLETGLAISQRLGDEFGIVLAEVGLAQLAVTQSRFEEAIAHIETVMGLSEAAGEHQIADARRLLALAQAGKGDLQTGLETAEQALEMAQTAGLAEMEADCRRVLGVLHARAGDYLEAEVLLHEAIDLCLQLNVPYGQGWALFELGRLYQNLAHIADPTQAEWRAKALTALGEAIEQFERLGAARDLQMVRATLSQLQAETAADRKVIDIRVSLIANRFEISDLEKDLLGGGEMGHVYRGTDTQTGQAVAIKVLKPEILASQPDIVARFIREGESLRQLNHPNIVQMVDAIEENGQHYIIMEYVAGGSLRDLLEAGKPLSVTRILEITLELADALSRAHHLGIIHRNLKPANVLLAEDGTPRLTDFGHAHLAASTRLTRTGELMGSVGYLSPEACNGEALDNRADLWALGVLLYEMLTGELPFMGETLIAAITAILTQPVPDLASLRPDAPDALVELVCRMLEKDRQRRIPSARLVGAELEAILGVVSSQ